MWSLPTKMHAKLAIYIHTHKFIFKFIDEMHRALQKKS